VCATEYYSYRWILFIVVWVQIIANAAFEFGFIGWLTRTSDARIERKKSEKFLGIMEVL
jgi:hypothetical protein